jgi:long-subunit fatty acid transport protein
LWDNDLYAVRPADISIGAQPDFFQRYWGVVEMKRTLVIAMGFALVGTNSAYAITDSETNASIPFNLSAPGARSMGMGGAFLGLADDATAAYTNPAGLTQLVTPEVSAEARHTSYSIPYANGGSATIDPFSAAKVNSSDSSSSTSNLSFLSFVLPHDRWSFAFYRDELVHFDGDFSADGTILGDNQFETFPLSAHSNLKIIDYGVTAAYKAADNVSLGIGLSYYDFNINTAITRSEFEGNDAGIPAGTPVNQQIQRGSDHDVGVNLGARFVLSEHLSAGLVYRQGGKFDYRASSTVLVDPVTVVADLSKVKFKVPDEYGAGLSWHPNDNFVLNFDADFIQYSQLTHGIQSLFGNDPAVVSRLSIPNGTEYHLGGEYTFTQMAHPFSVRAGVWHDPRHSIEYKGADPGDDIGALGLATLFGVGKGSQTHFSLGGGFAFAKFQIDAAADFSDLSDMYSISAVYHF